MPFEIVPQTYIMWTLLGLGETGKRSAMLAWRPSPCAESTTKRPTPGAVNSLTITTFMGFRWISTFATS